MRDSEELLRIRKGIRSVFQDAQTAVLERWVVPGQRILETGCGYGFFLEKTSAQAELAVGLDMFLSPASSVLNRKQVSAVRGDAVKLPFKDGSFDTVYSMDVIEHVEDDLAFIAEALRVLKTNGLLIVGTPNRKRLSARIKRLLGKPNRYPLHIPDRVFGSVTHLREYTRKELLGLISRFPVRVEEVVPLFFGLTEPFPIGLQVAPGFLAGLCQFWMVKSRKKV